MKNHGYIYILTNPSFENYIKIGVGTAKNAAPALFLCSKTRKMLVYFLSFFAQIKNNKNIAS